MNPGDTFLFPCYPDATPHLWVIINKPFPPENKIIIISISTFTSKSDQTVIIESGDHPWIKHKSFVAYNFSRLQTNDWLKTQLNLWIAKQKEAMPEVIFSKIKKGILNSKFTPNFIKTFYKSILENTEPPPKT